MTPDPGQDAALQVAAEPLRPRRRPCAHGAKEAAPTGDVAPASQSPQLQSSLIVMFPFWLLRHSLAQKTLAAA